MRRGAAAVTRKILVRLSCGNIKLLGIFLHHALRVEHGRDATDGFAHQLQPGEGKFAVRFRVIKRNDLVLEQLIQTAGVHFILKFSGAIVDLGANRPAVAAVVAFAPPAIEHAQVNPAVRRRFHSAGAACFQRSQRMVQPKIDPLHEPACDVAVVVLKKNDAIFQAGFAAKFVNLLDQCLACFVARMCFAREDELHRARGIIHQSLQSFLVTEQKRAAFVSDETARKPDG